MIGPSSRVKIIIASAIVVVSGTISASIYIDRSQAAEGGLQASAATEAHITRDVVANTDTNKDGIPDWMEEFGRVSSSSSVDDFSDYVPKPTNPDSLTSQLAVNLFSNYMAISGDSVTGGEISVEAINELATQAVAQAEAVDVYSAGSLTTYAHYDPDSLKMYGNSVVSIFYDHLKTVAEDPRAETDLSIIARAYRDMAEDMLTVPTPASLAGTHAKIMNNYYGVYVALRDISDFEEDPLRALVGIKTYQTAAEEQPQLFTTIENTLKQSGILFNETEPGFIGFENLRAAQ